MSVRNICDGCDQQIAGDPIKAGFVHRCDYCADCAGIHTAYQLQIDALHERLAQSWLTELEAIREGFRMKLNLLPDDAKGRQ